MLFRSTLNCQQPKLASTTSCESQLQLKLVEEVLGKTRIKCKYCGADAEPRRWKQTQQYWSTPRQCMACKNFKRRHGFTLTPSDREYLSSMNSCQICGVSSDLAIDHDHKTNRIRGMLCRRCNTTLGKFNEDISLFRKIINYLLSHSNATN